MQTHKNVNLAPESFRHSAVPCRLKHRARRRRRILCLLPVILVFGVLAAALLRFTPALAYADIFPAQATTRRIKDVPYISQLPTLPTGCESASAAMLLNYYGCTVTAEEFASYYLPTGDAPHTDENGELIGCDPWEAFPGDPFSETGWGCYSTVIERAMNEFLTNTGYHAERLSGVPLYRLKSYIDNNTPVMIWATICMEPRLKATFGRCRRPAGRLRGSTPCMRSSLRAMTKTATTSVTLSPGRTSTTAKTAWRSPTPPFSSRPSS